MDTPPPTRPRLSLGADAWMAVRRRQEQWPTAARGPANPIRGRVLPAVDHGGFALNPGDRRRIRLEAVRRLLADDTRAHRGNRRESEPGPSFSGVPLSVGHRPGESGVPEIEPQSRSGVSRTFPIESRATPHSLPKSGRRSAIRCDRQLVPGARQPLPARILPGEEPRQLRVRAHPVAAGAAEQVAAREAGRLAHGHPIVNLAE